jgi:hypothetical protein
MKPNPGMFDDMDIPLPENGKIDWSTLTAAASREMAESKKSISKSRRSRLQDEDEEQV